MRKIVASMAALAMLGLSLAGCSNATEGGSTKGEDKSDSSASTELSPDTEATLQLAIWDKAQRPTVDDMIAEFNKKYPKINIEVSVTAYKEYWDKLRTAAEGKNLPDIFWMNGPNFQLYAGNDQLADLSDLVEKKEVDLSNFPQGLVDLYTYDGKSYGVPKDFDTIAVWYRKDLFEQAGIPAPDGEWSWDDYREVCKQLKEKLPDVWPVTAYLIGDGQQTYYNTIGQADGYVIKDNKSGYSDPKTIKGLQFWADLVKDGYMPPTQLQTDPSSRTLFINGKSAMYWSGSWEAGSLKDNDAPIDKINVTALPHQDKKASVIHGLSWVVANTSKNQDAAKAFVAFAGTKDAQLLEAKNGSAIPAYEGTAAEWVKNTEPAWDLQVFIDAAEKYSMPYPVSKNSSAWNAVQDELLVPAFDAGADMKEPADKLATEMNALLEKE